MALPLAGLAWAGVSWAFREVIVKFVIMAAVYFVVTELAPVGLGLISSFLNVSALNAAFSGLSPGVWFFLDFARLDYGLPLIMSALVSAFLFRRIPFLNGR